MRQGHFWEAMQAYQEEREADRRHMGELVRGATLRLFNLQVRPQDRMTDPAKFWRMPWDKEVIDENAEEIKKITGATDEERTEMAREFIGRLGWDVDTEDGAEES